MSSARSVKVLESGKCMPAGDIMTVLRCTAPAWRGLADGRNATRSDGSGVIRKVDVVTAD